MSDFLHHLHQFLVLGALAKFSILGLKLALVGIVAGVAGAAKVSAALKRRRLQSTDGRSPADHSPRNAG